MRFVTYLDTDGRPALAVRRGTDLVTIDANEKGDKYSLLNLLQAGPKALKNAYDFSSRGKLLDEDNLTFLPPIPCPTKIICVGLNYVDHIKESGFATPTYPTVFPRWNSSLIGHRAVMQRPLCSIELDYEAEMVAVIGMAGRHINRADALNHVAGYSVFNEASIRDYQFKSPAWTVGKNFDATGAFGPEFVTADELPKGGVGLRLQARLNGQTVQDGNTRDMVFDVAQIIETLSEAITLEAGDVIVTGTPAGVGFARKPPIFLKEGDVIEIELEGVGILTNFVHDEHKK
jgi:2-keto-4-pentenoate hydratase/2-oxohepta-3-ene-1,7-dioic acid hydratase in catechol pathway